MTDLIHHYCPHGRSDGTAIVTCCGIVALPLGETTDAITCPHCQQVVSNMTAWLLLCYELDEYKDYMHAPIPPHCGGRFPGECKSDQYGTCPLIIPMHAQTRSP